MKSKKTMSGIVWNSNGLDCIPRQSRVRQSIQTLSVFRQSIEPEREQPFSQVFKAMAANAKNRVLRQRMRRQSSQQIEDIFRFNELNVSDISSSFSSNDSANSELQENIAIMTSTPQLSRKNDNRLESNSKRVMSSANRALNRLNIENNNKITPKLSIQKPVSKSSLKSNYCFDFLFPNEFQINNDLI
jgi:hypothetical protein